MPLVLAVELAGLSQGTPNILELISSEKELRPNCHYKIFEIIQEDLGQGDMMQEYENSGGESAPFDDK